MRERIDIEQAINLYRALGNWRAVAARLIRRNGMQFCADAVQRAVRRHDRGLA